MATRRDGSYVWVSWVTKLLAGEAHCEWAAWFRAHHTFEKVPSDFDRVAWNAQHAGMVRKRVDELKKDGFKVFIEDQNKFNFRGSQEIVLAGKPDIVAAGGGHVTVIDCKTGSPKMSDQFQVLVYMLVLPFTHDACRGRKPDGEVQYQESAVQIPAAKVSSELRQLFRDMMNRVGGSAALTRVPSYDECRFCDITSKDCPDRIESPPGQTDVKHDLF